MYVLIRDYANDCLKLVQVSEMGYDSDRGTMWIDSTAGNNRDVPISVEQYEEVVQYLFKNGKVDLSDTDLRAYYEDDGYDLYGEDYDEYE
jgi:hypothetical protein